MKRRLRIATTLAAIVLTVTLLPYVALYWAFSASDVQQWARNAVAPGKRVQSVAGVSKGKLYVFAGFQDRQLEPSSETYVYDPQKNSWSSKTNAPLALSHAAAAVDGTTVWIAGGFVGKGAQSPTSQVLAYDTDADSWRDGPPLPMAIGGGGLVRIGRTLHYLGGFAGRHDIDATDGHWTLDLDNPAQWQDAVPLPVARGHSGIVAIGQTIYVIGGSTRHGVAGKSTRRVSAYDAVTNEWQQLSNLPFPRSHFEAATLVKNGRIYVIGGQDDSSERLSQPELRDITVYDPGKDRWAHTYPLPVPLRSPVARVIDDTIYVSHGSTHWFEAPQQVLWTLECEDVDDNACVVAGMSARMAQLKGRIRSFAKQHVDALPIRLQGSLFLREIAHR